ncbi:peptidoglycan-binding domain-containing protein [uncultured Roseobacter sp.]|uniref:peptidoglycan-binding domain-containing protein n=1 Tax=uncultured Roseobacter sp. TaxID=114847 RepID=UPI00262F7A7A|nr:peptidoglycan-binding domain-containing protein [uncultured Roseobacter sp.]
MTQARKTPFRNSAYAVLATALLTACAPETPAVTASSPASQSPSSTRTSPPDAAPDTCWDKTETPAIIETVSERILIAPADIRDDGIIRKPAQYKKEDRQRILQPRQENWYQIVCADMLTPDFVTTLQRALSVRGYYPGAPTGQLDTATRDAIAGYQTAQDLPGFELTIEAAERLGLVAVRRS